MIKEQDRQKIVALLNALFPEAKIILLGFDIAIDENKRIESTRLGEALEILAASSVPHMFDLVDFQSLSKEMQEAILREGMILKQ